MSPLTSCPSDFWQLKQSLQRRNPLGSTLTVDVSRIIHNVQRMRRLSNCPSLFAAVVKADAYGLGANIIANRLQDACAVDAFMVALVGEAIDLRSSGIVLPILVAAGSFAGSYEDVLHYGLIPIVGNLADIVGLDQCARDMSTTARMHIEVDCGMSRHGFTLEEMDEVKRLISRLKNVNVIGAMTHPMYCGGRYTTTMREHIGEVFEIIRCHPNAIKDITTSEATDVSPDRSQQKVEEPLSAYNVNRQSSLSSTLRSARLCSSLSSASSSSSTTHSLSCSGDDSGFARTNTMSTSYGTLLDGDNWTAEAKSNAKTNGEVAVGDLTFHFTNSAMLACSPSTPSCENELSSQLPTSFEIGSGDMARIGLAMYGVQPFNKLPCPLDKLEPVLTWKTHVVALRTIHPGKTVGYDATWTATRETCVATICIGYADGYPRNLSNKAQVLISGQRANVIGRICMDYTMVDVTDIVGQSAASVSIGSPVILMGPSDSSALAPTVWDIAQWADTIPWEILSRISPRVERVYPTNAAILPVAGNGEDDE